MILIASSSSSSSSSGGVGDSKTEVFRFRVSAQRLRRLERLLFGSKILPPRDTATTVVVRCVVLFNAQKEEGLAERLDFFDHSISELHHQNVSGKTTVSVTFSQFSWATVAENCRRDVHTYQ